MAGVTNTQLAHKIDNLHDDFNSFRLDNEARLVYLETCMPSVEKQIEKVETKIDTVQKRGYILDGATGLLAAIGTILGIQK